MSLLVYITIVIESVSESLRSNECQRQRTKITTSTRKGQTFHQPFPFIFFAPRSFTQVISKPLLYVCLVEATLFLSLQLSVIFPSLLGGHRKQLQGVYGLYRSTKGRLQDAGVLFDWMSWTKTKMITTAIEKKGICPNLPMRTRNKNSQTS